MSEISLITIYQPIFPITHAGAKENSCEGRKYGVRKVNVEGAGYINISQEHLNKVCR